MHSLHIRQWGQGWVTLVGWGGESKDFGNSEILGAVVLTMSSDFIPLHLSVLVLSYILKLSLTVKVRGKIKTLIDTDPENQNSIRETHKTCSNYQRPSIPIKLK